MNFDNENVEKKLKNKNLEKKFDNQIKLKKRFEIFNYTCVKKKKKK